LAATDDSKLAQVKKDAERMKAVGEIVIQLFRTSTPVKKSFGANAELENNVTSPVHEKALKGDAKSHSTS
jgi:hypothetical protein